MKCKCGKALRKISEIDEHWIVYAKCRCGRDAPLGLKTGRRT